MSSTKQSFSNLKSNIKNQSFSASLFLQYARLRILELYYNFFKQFFFNTGKYEDIEVHTKLLYLEVEKKLVIVYNWKDKKMWTGT